MSKRYSLNSEEQIDKEIVKQEYSQVFTLKSIQSDQDYLEIIPHYQRKSNETLNSGKWNSKQHIKYIMFINFFQSIFLKKHNKKLWKIFSIMSSFIKTRNSSQCRSHHQKMQKRYENNAKQLVNKEKQKYKNYDSKYQQMKKNLQKIQVQYPQQKFQDQNSCANVKILQEEFQLQEQQNSQVSKSYIKKKQKKYKYKNISLLQIDFQKKQQYFSNKKTREFIQSKSQKNIDSNHSIQIEDEYQNILLEKDEKQKQVVNFCPNTINQKSEEKKDILIKTNDTYIEEKLNYVKKPKNTRTSLISFANDDFEEPFFSKNSEFHAFKQSNYKLLQSNIETNNPYFNIYKKKSSQLTKAKSFNQCFEAFLNSSQNDSGSILIHKSIQNSVLNEFVSNLQSDVINSPPFINQSFQNENFHNQNQGFQSDNKSQSNNNDT